MLKKLRRYLANNVFANASARRGKLTQSVKNETQLLHSSHFPIRMFSPAGDESLRWKSKWCVSIDGRSVARLCRCLDPNQATLVREKWLRGQKVSSLSRLRPSPMESVKHQTQHRCGKIPAYPEFLTSNDEVPAYGHAPLELLPFQRPDGEKSYATGSISERRL